MFVISLVLCITGSAFGQDAHNRNCRDRFLEPFSSDSIWNTAIGSAARFSPANLFSSAEYYPDNFHNDQDFIIRVRKTDPYTVWINQGDWGADDKCTVQKKSHTGMPCDADSKQTDGCTAQIQLPYDWTSASDCDGAPLSNASNCRSKGNQVNNNAMAVLMADNVTLVQMQPAYRCGFGNPFFARWGNTTDGGPQQFPNRTSILGDGILGAHGGSGLSSMGGSIRLAELLPHVAPIGHALKIELNNWWYYGLTALNPATEYNGGRTQYVWPATGSNAGVNPKSNPYKGTNPVLAPGALLAIPATLAPSIKTTTVIGAKIKQAMLDYGGYIVDGTGGSNNGPTAGGKPGHRNLAAICMDAEVNAEMRRTYGYALTYPHGVNISSPVDKGGALYLDLLHIFQGLHAVTNNGPGSVGGGGTPRQPRKPDICDDALSV